MNNFEESLTKSKSNEDWFKCYLSYIYGQKLEFTKAKNKCDLYEHS